MTFGTFFLPGPTEVRRAVLEAMLQPMVPHRGARFAGLFERVQRGLQSVFQTTRPVFISTSSATGFMEAAVRCAPRGPVLSLVNGAFSERFARIAEACGHPVDRYEVPWGEAHDLAEIRTRMTANSYIAVTVVHSETSTGVLNPLRDIAHVVRSFGAFCLADSVSGMGGAEVQTDGWDLDLVLTGSQKALALPPGLAFASVSERFLNVAAEQRDKGVYFDLTEFANFAAKGQAPNTPAIPLYYALERQLQDIERETMTSRWQRHANMAAMTVDWVERWEREVHPELRVLAPAGVRSPTVTTMTLPAGLSAKTMIDAVAQRGFVIGSGYGKLKDSTIRIGHMGDHTPERLEACLATCDAVLRALL